MIWKFKKHMIKDHKQLVQDLNSKDYFEGIEGNKYVYEVPESEYMPDTAIMLYDTGIEVLYPLAFVEGPISILNEELPENVSFKYDSDGFPQTLSDLNVNVYKSLDELRCISAINPNGRIYIEDLIAFYDSVNFNLINVNEQNRLINSSDYTNDPKNIPNYNQIDEDWEDWFNDYLQARDNMYQMMLNDGFENLTNKQKEICSKWRVVEVSKNILSERAYNNTAGIHERHKIDARNRRFGNVYTYAKTKLTQPEINGVRNDINEHNFYIDYNVIGMMGSNIEHYETGATDAVAIGDYILGNNDFDSSTGQYNGLPDQITSLTGTAKQQFIGAIYNMIVTGKWV